MINISNSKVEVVAKYYEVVNSNITFQAKANYYEVASQIERLMTQRGADRKEINQFKYQLEKRLNMEC